VWITSSDRFGGNINRGRGWKHSLLSFFLENRMVEINITDSTGKQPRKVGFYANQPENNNLAEINAFKLVIGKIPETTYFCQSANLPGISISEFSQQTMFNPVL